MSNLNVTYYTLFIRDDKESPWGPEFGDYVYSVVADEMDDLRDDYPRGCLKIVRTGDTQREIDEMTKHLNRKR